MSRSHQRLVVITRVSVGVSVWMPELFIIYPIEQIGVPLAFEAHSSMPECKVDHDQFAGVIRQKTASQLTLNPPVCGPNTVVTVVTATEQDLGV